MGSEGKKTTGGGTRGRVYDAMLDWHLRRDRQMAFVAGPRQVGKTTTCRRHADEVLNWDNADDRAVILAGPAATAQRLALERLPDEERIVRAPRRITDGEWMALWEHGGFPEPFTKRDRRFTRRWAALRRQQLVREDIRDLTHIHELGQIEALVRYLESHSGDQVIYSTLAGVVGVSVDTARRWVATLAGFYLPLVVPARTFLSQLL